MTEQQSQPQPQQQRTRSESFIPRDGETSHNVLYQQSIDLDDCAQFSTHQDTIDVSNQIQAVKEKLLEVEDEVKTLETEIPNKTEFENQFLKYNKRIELLYENIRAIKADVEQLQVQVLKLKNLEKK